MPDRTSTIASEIVFSSLLWFLCQRQADDLWLLFGESCQTTIVRARELYAYTLILVGFINLVGIDRRQSGQDKNRDKTDHPVHLGNPPKTVSYHKHGSHKKVGFVRPLVSAK